MQIKLSQIIRDIMLPKYWRYFDMARADAWTARNSSAFTAIASITFTLTEVSHVRFSFNLGGRGTDTSMGWGHMFASINKAYLTPIDSWQTMIYRDASFQLYANLGGSVVVENETVGAHTYHLWGAVQNAAGAYKAWDSGNVWMQIDIARA